MSENQAFTSLTEKLIQEESQVPKIAREDVCVVRETT